MKVSFDTLAKAVYLESICNINLKKKRAGRKKKNK